MAGADAERAGAAAVADAGDDALAGGADAHRKMERSDFFGKIVLEP